MTHMIWAIPLVCGMGPDAAAQSLQSIDPTGRTDVSQSQVTLLLHGTGLNTPGLTLSFGAGMSPAPVTDASQDGTTAAARFTIDSSATGSFEVTLMKGSTAFPTTLYFDSGVVGNVCLESVGSNCVLRWELDTTAATNANSQSGSTTSPNFLTTLDYQFVSPHEPSGLTQAKRSRDVSQIRAHRNDKQKFPDRLVAHFAAKAGFTQVSAANTVQSAGNGASSVAGTKGSQISCPANFATSTSGTVPATLNCTAVSPQQAFVAGLAVNGGITFGRNGRGVFSVLSFQGRGEFEDLLSSNQVLESGNITYVDLSANNPRTVVGLYEGTASFTLSSWNHDQPANPDGSYGNVSNLLVVEFGYQYNSGLQQLIATAPQTDTRERFVGRFYLYPEIPNGKTHTKGEVGVEFSGGLHGGPKVVQIFWGLNLNPARLFQ